MKSTIMKTFGLMKNEISFKVFLTFLFCSLAYGIFFIYTNIHHSSKDKQKNYNWIFKDSTIQKIHPYAQFC